MPLEQRSISTQRIGLRQAIAGAIATRFSSIHPRTANYRHQLYLSVIFKVANAILSLAVVAATVRYLGTDQYGVWSTLFTLVSWLFLFDVGLSTGTRNKVSESLANATPLLARSYISTSYVALGAISALLFLTFLYVNPIIDWQAIFNTTSVSSEDLGAVTLTITLFALLNLVLGLAHQLCHAIQRSSLSVMTQFLAGLVTFGAVAVLVFSTSGNLLYLVWVNGFAHLAANITLTVKFFTHRPDLAPALRYFRRDSVRNLLGLGLKFFLMQLAVLAIFTTDKLLISQLFGPAFVTPYDLVMRIFGLMTLIQFTILTPLWSALTEAYTKDDIAWVRNTLASLIIALIPIYVGLLALAWLAPFLVNTIAGGLDLPEFLLAAGIAFHVILFWCNIYAYFLQSASKLHLSLILSGAAALINIPASIFFAKTMGIGPAGILIGSIISLLPGAILGPMQVLNVLNSRGAPIWHR